MLCSSCGYDNPREHRYCGMCGTPFPHRPLTVPDAQSTLTFSSAPLVIAPTRLHAHVAEAPAPAPLDVYPIEASPSAAIADVTPYEAAPVVEAVAIEPAEPPAFEHIEVEHAEILEPEPSVIDHAQAEDAEVERASIIEAASPQPVAEPSELAPPLVIEELAPPPHFEEPPLEAPPIAEEVALEPAEPPAFAHIEVGHTEVERAEILEAAPSVIDHAQAEDAEVERDSIIEAASPAPAPAEPVVEPTEPAPQIALEKLAPPPHFEEPPLETQHVAEAVALEPAEPPVIEHAEAAPIAPVVEPPPVPPDGAVAPPSVAAEPAPAAPEATRHEPPAPEVSLPETPAPHIVVRPASSRRDAPAARKVNVKRTPEVAHPSPDSLPITLPPESAGMPTYQSVAEASGTPPISPFEPPAEKHPDEDRELQEYIASFRYTPPEETADELTMRSEVPVIDTEAPAEFHHPSFDGDEPPPPEAGPHPTGEEYYPPAGSAGRSRFLEISDTQHATSGQRASTGTSFLGLDGPAPSTSADDAAPTSRRHWWLWSSLAALLAIFGGLGFLEGRAQSTHAFRGPVEVIREQYNSLRQRLAQTSEAPPTGASAPRTTGTEQQPEPSSKPAATDQAASTPQPDTSAQTNPPTAAPTTQPDQQQQTPAASATAPDTKSTTAKTETAKAEPAKPIEAPSPKASSKPQLGQQELTKAMNASDPTAAAAWLWKATSRGNPEAPIRLADMYIKGQGVPRSCEQALVLLRSAATKENALARNRLAALYANGTCVARDPVKAYQLMSSALAADPTSAWAQQNREQLWKHMTLEERAEAQKYR